MSLAASIAMKHCWESPTACKTTLETSGENVKTTLETSEEDVKTTLETSVVFQQNL